MKKHDVTKVKKAYDAACAALEAATARHAEALAKKIGYPFEYEDSEGYKTAIANFERFAVADAEATMLEARDAKELAARALARALDDSELTEQNPHALACDVDALRQTVAEDAAEEARLERALEEVRARSAAVLAGATAAWERWAAERREAKRPLPRRLGTPAPPKPQARIRQLPCSSILTALTLSEPTTGSNAERVRMLRNEATDLAAALEAYKKQVFSARLRAGRFDRDAAKEEKKRREREAAEHQAAVERHAAAEAERERNADAFRARVGGSR